MENVLENTDELTKDPYAYLDRDDFTSEKYKIEVRGLPKYYGIGEFKKLLNEKHALGSSKVKPPRKGSPWVYVCFRSQESREHAIATLNGLSWKNSTLTAQVHTAFCLISHLFIDSSYLRIYLFHFLSHRQPSQHQTHL